MTKTIRKQPATPQHFTSVVNYNRPWHKTDIVAGNLILNWHGQEVARVCSNKMNEQEAKATRDLIVRAVNAFDAAMRVVNLMALMKHTCAKRKGGQTVTVHECVRCLAKIAQTRAEAR